MFNDIIFQNLLLIINVDAKIQPHRKSKYKVVLLGKQALKEIDILSIAIVESKEISGWNPAV